MMKTVKRETVKRKGYSCIIDTETANSIDFPLCFDVGYTILNENDEIVEQKGFLVKEIWENEKLMNEAYYSCNIPLYEKVPRQIKNWAYVRAVIQNKIESCEFMYAYNGQFDVRAINSTNKYFKRQTQEIDMICLWSLSLQLIHQTEDYRNFAEENNLVTPSGKFYQSNAEATYKYIKQEDFTELHMATEDSSIESEILKYIKGLNQEYDTTKKPNVYVMKID